MYMSSDRSEQNKPWRVSSGTSLLDCKRGEGRAVNYIVYQIQNQLFSLDINSTDMFTTDKLVYNH